MTGKIILALFAVLVIAGCSSDFRLFSWGNARSKATEAPDISFQTPRHLAPQIIDLKLEPTAFGAIIHATGMPHRQGYYDSELVPVRAQSTDEGTLTLEFWLTPPEEPTRAGTPVSREILAATQISARNLSKVKLIRVISASNSLTVRP